MDQGKFRDFFLRNTLTPYEMLLKLNLTEICAMKGPIFLQLNCSVSVITVYLLGCVRYTSFRSYSKSQNARDLFFLS